MDCPVCQSTEHTQFTNPNTNAPIFQCVFGVDILECKSCKFIFADFIHPNTINLFYNYFCRSRHTADDFKKLREGAKKSGQYAPDRGPSRSLRPSRAPHIPSIDSTQTDETIEE